MRFQRHAVAVGLAEEMSALAVVPPSTRDHDAYIRSQMDRLDVMARSIGYKLVRQFHPDFQGPFIAEPIL